MRALIVRPTGNRRGRRDYSGAFLPESEKFARWWRGLSSLRVADVLELGERDSIDPLLELIAHPKQGELYDSERAPLGRVAFFCHGGARALYLGGLRVGSASFGYLCEALAQHAGPSLVVNLYACNAGAGDATGGDGCFADELRDRLVALGKSARVDAHTTAGHTTTNPHVRRFESELGGVGGSWLVRPRSELWKPWARALRAADPFRWEFSHLEAWEIHERIGGAVCLGCGLRRSSCLADRERGHDRCCAKCSHDLTGSDT